MTRSLKERFPGLYPVYLKRPPFKLRRKLNSLTRKWLNRTRNLAHSSVYSRFLARQIQDAFRTNPPDIAIAPAFSAAICHLKTNVPVIYVSDTTFRLMYGYYDWFSDFWPCSVREGNRIERLAIHNSVLSVFASGWAARSAVEDYQADPEKVKVIPFGANLPASPAGDPILRKEMGDKLRLIFIGMEWDRKGGPIVLDTFHRLQESGVSVQLDIVGCDPPIPSAKTGIRIFPFIDKSSAGGAMLFSSIMAEQHLLFVPSRAECFGLVFAEASAYGIPSITTDTGGIPDVVINGENGYRLPLNAGPEDYARVISDIYQHFNEHYIPLSLASSRLYQSRLNWDRWADEMSPLILGVLANSQENPG